MFYKLIYRLQILGVILTLTALTADLASHYFFAETLYPVESVETVDQSANPFTPIIPRRPSVPTVSSPDEDIIFARQLDQRNIKLSAFANSPEAVSSNKLDHCKALVEQTLTALSPELIASLDDLTLYFSQHEPRGLSNSHVIELRCGELTDAEIVSVFVHELGHVIDLGYLRGSGAVGSFTDGSYEIPESDLSTEYYRISWINTKTKRLSSQREDYVSGYASTDPFEDFAESFDFYVLHGADFRALTKESSTLEAKYDFLREQIFFGVEFDSRRVTESGKRVWDVTLLKFDLAEFFTRGKDQSSIASR